ncbi:hypothetical protein INS49_008933 [Diaporthe citri]|uniref:uncharacterized protein n=1 Tax=Diaporthe citri TaxID=83186 RepID=UPI001C7F61AF|nr:uncharacterized protein INS49_008933 [Diaporthe citri]KAG6363830.1 hypothetical protein INS49_008933 [Diaporthe citri]
MCPECSKAGKPLTIETTDLKLPGKGEVLVKVEACGVCFSDISSAGWHGGHDGQCKACKKGWQQMCDNQVVNGETKNGGYAEYCILRAEATARVPEHVDAAAYAPILCAGMTVFNSLRHTNLAPGDTVAVQGLGGLGHLAIQYASRTGYRVVAISRGSDKEKFARQLGAHEYIDAGKEDPGQAIQRLGRASLAMATAPTADSITPLLSGLGILGKLLVLSVPGDLTVNTGVMLKYAVSVQCWPCGHAYDSEDTIAFTEQQRINCMIEKFPLVKANDAFTVERVDGKGKIQRQKTYSLYEDDIEVFYSAVDKIQDQVVVGAYVSFFELGMDSLQVLRMTTEMRVQLEIMGGYPQQRLERLSPKFIYAHHSLSRLSSFFLWPCGDAVKEMSHPRGSSYQSGGSASSSEDIPPTTQMQTILDEYAAGLPHPRLYHPGESPYHSTSADSQAKNMTVLLTGSTGSLGSYLLEELCHNGRVSKIVCLNRSLDAAKRHASMIQSRGLNALDPSRVLFYKADLSKRQLGLAEGIYEQLLRTVTHIIHNQWPVNFNWSLASFAPYIAGVRNLAEMALHSRHDAFLLFVSSVSSVGGWNKSEAGQSPALPPEDPVSNLGQSANIGYAQSKLIAECLLDQAAAKSRLRLSSSHMGVFPTSFPSRDRIDWIPVDKLARVLVEIMHWASSATDRHGDCAAAGAQVYHVVNPQVRSWEADLAPAMLSAFRAGNYPVRGVPFPTWVDELARVSQTYTSSHDGSGQGGLGSESVLLERRVPAIRLLDFFLDIAAGDEREKCEERSRALTSEKAERASKTLRELGAIRREWIDNWLEQWGIKSTWLKLC